MMVEGRQSRHKCLDKWRWTSRKRDVSRRPHPFPRGGEGAHPVFKIVKYNISASIAWNAQQKCDAHFPPWDTRRTRFHALAQTDHTRFSRVQATHTWSCPRMSRSPRFPRLETEPLCFATAPSETRRNHASNLRPRRSGRRNPRRLLPLPPRSQKASPSFSGPRKRLNSSSNKSEMWSTSRRRP